MHSKQKIQTTRFSRTKTVSAYFIAGHYLMGSSLAYAAGPGKPGLDLDSKTTITRFLNKPSNTPQSNDENSSYFSFFQNKVSNTLDWMHESALSSCDRLGRWIASYGEDIPPSYFAKSLLEVDYANDELFWQGHFNQELEDIKESPYLGSQGRTRLKELQDIVWNGLLSPYAYEKGLQQLGKKSSFSVVKKMKSEFQAELKENPEIVLNYLRKDFIKSLEGMQNKEKENEQTLAKLEKKLAYYSNTINAFDYAETLAGILARVEEQKGKIALSTTQHEALKASLSNALRNTNGLEIFVHKRRAQSCRVDPKNVSTRDRRDNTRRGTSPRA